MTNSEFPLFDRRPKRKLAAILAADVVGFSKMMGENEDRTLSNLKACREITDGAIREHHGRVFGTAGDSIIAEFASPVDAILAAVEFQRNLRDRNLTVTPENQMQFRVGLNLGDVIVEGDNLFGDGVNVAARLEPLAKPGGICISGKFHDEVHRKLELIFENVGPREVKNIDNPVQTYDVILDPDTKKSSTKKSSNVSENRKVEAAYSLPNQQPENFKPRIMLFPFRNLNNQEDNEFLVDGIVEDIITELSMINSIEVMSRETTFDLKEKNFEIKELTEKYNLSYFVTGSIRSAGKKVRVNAELTDPTGHGSLWSARFEKIMDDVFEIQDELVRKISDSVLNEIEVTSLNRAKRKPTEDLNSYEFLLRGKFHKQKKNKEDQNIAVEMFTKAIEYDPENGRAYAEKCCTLAGGLNDENLFSLSSDQIWDNIHSLLGQAYELTNQDWDCHRMLCGVNMHFEKYTEALNFGKKGFELNPNSPGMLRHYGMALIFTGNYDQGLNILYKAMELDPLSESIIDALIWANYAAKNYEECLEFKPLSKYFTPSTWILRIACLGALCREQERNEEVKSFIDLHGREEMSKELANLKFNNVEIENNIRLLVNNEAALQAGVETNEAKDMIPDQIN